MDMQRMKMKKEPWRIAVAGVSVAFIVAILVAKGMRGVWDAVPEEQLFPMLVTNVAVTTLKVLVVTGGIWAVRRIGNLLTQKKS